MSLTLANVLGAMPETDEDLTATIASVKLCALQCVSAMQDHSSAPPNKWMVAMAIMQNRSVLDIFIDREATDQVFNTINNLTSIISNRSKADTRLVNSYNIMNLSPTV